MFLEIHVFRVQYPRDVWYPVDNSKIIFEEINTKILEKKEHLGLGRDLNPGPLAPKARIIPLDHRATVHKKDPRVQQVLRDKRNNKFSGRMRGLKGIISSILPY
ncbi:hypothetical protein TNCT_594571 [Trichonephila clavata]|uniref:Uncharacterized protein n=1 Tax=Trichonephila clavata TaxID=2740835 RepID=A0A8X6H934_TRICU|nr:hypothetical protein TNCT_594571 [Trichonephila clavata]